MAKPTSGALPVARSEPRTRTALLLESIASTGKRQSRRCSPKLWPMPTEKVAPVNPCGSDFEKPQVFHRGLTDADGLGGLDAGVASYGRQRTAEFSWSSIICVASMALRVPRQGWARSWMSSGASLTNTSRTFSTAFR